MVRGNSKKNNQKKEFGNNRMKIPLWKKIEKAVENNMGRLALGDSTDDHMDEEIVDIVERHFGKKFLKTKIIKLRVLDI